jgi:hypothetical protein
MAETTTKSKKSQKNQNDEGPNFPGPSMSLIEFGDALGLLLAARTERNTEKKQIVLKKVAYIRIESASWGAQAFPEIWIQQNKEGLYMAVEAENKRIFPYPSRHRYEVAFLGREIFECAIKCLKEKKITPLYELSVVIFASREGFSTENGYLLAPDSYAAEQPGFSEDKWIPPPPPIES